MEYFYDKDKLAKWLNISRMQLYRLFAKYPPPDNWFNPFCHKERKRDGRYWPYDKLQCVRSSQVCAWLKVIVDDHHIEYKTRLKFKQRINES